MSRLFDYPPDQVFKKVYVVMVIDTRDCTFASINVFEKEEDAITDAKLWDCKEGDVLQCRIFAKNLLP